MRFPSLTAAIAVAAPLLAAAIPLEAPARLELTLRPVAGTGGVIEGIDVTLAGERVAADADRPLARLPLIVNNVDTVVADVNVNARDAAGPLPLTVRTEREGLNAARLWLPGRPVQGRWILHYRAPVGGRTASRGAAPPIELRAEGGAVSGAGSSFLLLPPGSETARLAVRWDLSALPKGAAAVSSFGSGDVTLKAPQPATRFERSYFMAGAIGHYASGSFFAAWQGTPPFDARVLMAWTGRLYGHYVAFFRPPQVQPYGVFLRPNPVNAGGGFGLAGSFIATFGPKTDPEELKLTLAHEMFHTFAPSIARPAGLESSWFGEGLAVFYARTLALRFGQIGPKAFLDDLNGTAGRYYTSVMATVPNSEVPARFWADTRIRTLPYDRGALYFATVDDAMRKASSGRRSLDDLMLAMLARERSRRTLTNADWEDLLRQNLGEPAVADFRAMLAGHKPLPASDAFGPCFRRTTRPLRRYELGFEPAVLTEPRRTVRGLLAGSAAEQAGLRNGDEIMKPVPQDAIQGNQTQRLTLEIRRDGRIFDITYLPRGEIVQAWQWERVPGVPDARCAR